MSVKQVNSTQALMKWSYKTSTLEAIYRQLSGDQQLEASSSWSTIEIEPEDLVKNLYFELYIMEKASNLSKTSRFMPKFPWLTSFRTLDGIDCALIDVPPPPGSSPYNLTQPSLLQSASSSSSDIVFRAKSSRLSSSQYYNNNNNKRNKRAAPSSIHFEIALDHLVPSTLYSLELAARIFYMESFVSRPIRFTTTG